MTTEILRRAAVRAAEQPLIAALNRATLTINKLVPALLEAEKRADEMERERDALLLLLEAAGVTP